MGELNLDAEEGLHLEGREKGRVGLVEDIAQRILSL